MIALILALSCFAVAEEESYTIGIAQFAEHGSWTTAAKASLPALPRKASSKARTSPSNTRTRRPTPAWPPPSASNFVANGYDLICAIATPIAVCAYNAAEDEIP